MANSLFGSYISAPEFRRAVSAIPTGIPEGRVPFAAISRAERVERMQLLHECLEIGFGVDQAVEFLKTRGLKLSRTTVYDYLGRMRVPKHYAPAESQQSPHDNLAYWTLIRIAKDAARHGWPVEGILKNRPCSGMLRFRPDLRFELAGREFFVEMQIRHLSDGAWSTKYENYVRLHEKTREPFAVLFILDRDRWFSRARYFAREALFAHPGSNLILFGSLGDLSDAGKNVTTDPVWQTPWDEPARVPLVPVHPPGGPVDSGHACDRK